jgi:hypothetical protein
MKYKYKLMRWDRTPTSKPKEALFDGQPMNIETDQEKPLKYAVSKVVEKLKSLPEFDTVKYRTDPGDEDNFRPDDVINLIATVKGQEEGYDIIPKKKADMLSSGYSRMMYNIIEDDFNKFLSYIPLEEDLIDEVYSPRLADIIIRLGREIENFFKAWLDSPYSDMYQNVESCRNGRRMMSDLKIFFEPITKLSLNEVYVKNLGYSIYPFEDFSKSGERLPYWWTLYNNQKHKAYENRKYATIRNTLYPLAALFVLNCLIPTDEDVACFEKFGFTRPNARECSSTLFMYRPWYNMLSYSKK